MEPMTAWFLAFQLVALFSIAGALLVYLICKLRDDNAAANRNVAPQPGTVLITSADTALGLQLCTHLANKGCRVFAGMRDAEDSLPAKLLNRWIKMREFNGAPISGIIVPMPLDVTREDVMRETTIAVGAHLNAFEHGIEAVINNSGSLFRGPIETQDVQQWEHMLRTNILGALRVAKTFLSFLRPTNGRLIYLANGTAGDGLVAFNASRAAVDKCAEDLRLELQQFGVDVIALDTTGVSPEALYKPPEAQQAASSVDSNGSVTSAPLQYSADVLNANALKVIENALWDVAPKPRYQLQMPQNKYKFLLPCRRATTLRWQKPNASEISSVQSV